MAMTGFEVLLDLTGNIVDLSDEESGDLHEQYRWFADDERFSPELRAYYTRLADLLQMDSTRRAKKRAEEVAELSRLHKMSSRRPVRRRVTGAC